MREQDPQIPKDQEPNPETARRPFILRKAFEGAKQRLLTRETTLDSLSEEERKVVKDSLTFDFSDSLFRSKEFHEYTKHGLDAWNFADGWRTDSYLRSVYNGGVHWNNPFKGTRFIKEIKRLSDESLNQLTREIIEEHAPWILEEPELPPDGETLTDREKEFLKTYSLRLIADEMYVVTHYRPMTEVEDPNNHNKKHFEETRSYLRGVYGGWLYLRQNLEEESYYKYLPERIKTCSEATFQSILRDGMKENLPNILKNLAEEDYGTDGKTIDRLNPEERDFLKHEVRTFIEDEIQGIIIKNERLDRTDDHADFIRAWIRQRPLLALLKTGEPLISSLTAKRNMKLGDKEFDSSLVLELTREICAEELPWILNEEESMTTIDRPLNSKEVRFLELFMTGILKHHLPTAKTNDLGTVQEPDSEQKKDSEEAIALILSNYEGKSSITDMLDLKSEIFAGFLPDRLLHVTDDDLLPIMKTVVEKEAPWILI